MIFVGVLSFYVEQCAAPLFGYFDDKPILSCEKDGTTFELVVNPAGSVGVRDNSDPDVGGTYYSDSAVTVHHRATTNSAYRHIRLEEQPWALTPDYSMQTSHVFYLKEAASGNATHSFVTGYLIFTDFGDGGQQIELQCESKGGALKSIEHFHWLREQYDMSASRPEAQGGPFNRDFQAVADAHSRS